PARPGHLTAVHADPTPLCAVRPYPSAGCRLPAAVCRLPSAGCRLPAAEQLHAWGRPLDPARQIVAEPAANAEIGVPP
ncbi:ATP-binding protein, partial [Streptomyces sp. NPDC059627]